MIDFFGVAALVYLTCFGGTLEEREGKPSKTSTRIGSQLRQYKSPRQKGRLLSVVGDEVKQCDVSADILSKVISIAIIDLA